MLYAKPFFMQENIEMKIKFSPMISFFLIVFLLGFSSNVFGSEKGDKDEKDGNKPAKIEAVIDGTGVIDRISSSEVVLGDQMFKLAPNVSKRLAVDGSTYSGTLTQGMLIGIELNKNREVVTIWVLKQNK